MEMVWDVDFSPSSETTKLPIYNFEPMPDEDIMGPSLYRSNLPGDIFGGRIERVKLLHEL